MTQTGIECFLAICSHKTASAAAQALYITQPSLSARLKVLEQEVGAQLFYRSQGSREMVLTQAGREFYQLAQQYDALIKKMKKLGDDNKASLRVSCFNSLGTYLLPAVYQLFLQENPQISLQMQDMELVAASQSILRGETDLAFTTGRSYDRQLKQFPAFSEPMVMICAAESDLASPVTVSQLSTKDEVFIGWSPVFSQWHKKTFGIARPQLCVATMAQLRQLLDQKGRWAIVPISVAKPMAQECNIRQLETDTLLPRREISCVVSAQRTVDALDGFLSTLRHVLRTYPEFEVYL